MEKTILNFLFDYLNPSHSRGVKKPGYFTVRLTVTIHPGPAPPPSYGQLFVNIFSILVYDSMCS